MSAPQTLLNGLRVLNTRPLEQAVLLSQAISEAGGLCIHLPALSIEPVEADWLQELPTFKNVQQAIFISANAVTWFFAS